VALAAADPGLTFTTALQAPRQWGWAVSKGHPEFVQFLNALVERLQADGRWNAAARKWLNGYDDTFNPQIK
jgi:polar amino acid transport system substrate-binding protein